MGGSILLKLFEFKFFYICCKVTLYLSNLTLINRGWSFICLSAVKIISLHCSRTAGLLPLTRQETEPKQQCKQPPLQIKLRSPLAGHGLACFITFRHNILYYKIVFFCIWNTHLLCCCCSFSDMKLEVSLLLSLMHHFQVFCFLWQQLTGRNLSYIVAAEILLLYMMFVFWWTSKKSTVWTNIQTAKVQCDLVVGLPPGKSADMTL